MIEDHLYHRSLHSQGQSSRSLIRSVNAMRRAYQNRAIHMEQFLYNRRPVEPIGLAAATCYVSA